MAPGSVLKPRERREAAASVARRPPGKGSCRPLPVAGKTFRPAAHRRRCTALPLPRAAGDSNAAACEVRKRRPYRLLTRSTAASELALRHRDLPATDASSYRRQGRRRREHRRFSWLPAAHAQHGGRSAGAKRGSAEGLPWRRLRLAGGTSQAAGAGALQLIWQRAGGGTLGGGARVVWVEHAAPAASAGGLLGGGVERRRRRGAVLLAGVVTACLESRLRSNSVSLSILCLAGELGGGAVAELFSLPALWLPAWNAACGAPSTICQFRAWRGSRAAVPHQS